MIFWPTPQICEACNGHGTRVWKHPKRKRMWLECFACNGFGSHGWIGPAKIIIHRLKKKNT